MKFRFKLCRIGTSTLRACVMLKLVFAATIFVNMATAPALADDPIVLRPALSMTMPASGYTTDRGYIGFEVDLINALLEGMPQDLDVTFVDAPSWNRSLENIEHGELSFLTLVSYREERLSFMDYIGVTGTEAAYLLTQDTIDIPALDTIESLALGAGFVAVDADIAWNPAFEQRLQDDPNYAANFIVRPAGEYNRVLDVERLATDPEYKALMESEYDLVYEDGNAAIYSAAKRVSYGRLGGTIMIEGQAIQSIQENAERIAAGGPGTGLKAKRIAAFGTPVTYLAASLHTPVAVRDHMKSRYAELRESGAYDQLWMRWYGDLESPPFVLPGQTQ